MQATMSDCRAVLCIIGTEITRGTIRDSHAQFLCSELTRAGFTVVRVIQLPDDGSIAAVLAGSFGDADLILTTGGLGPTTDDMTRAAIAEAAGRELVENRRALAQLQMRLNREPDEANRSQVQIPEGFTMVDNPLGTAPGFWGTIGTSLSGGSEGQTLLVAMPGPPRELQEMFLKRVLPLLKNRFPGVPDSERKELSVFLVPESPLERMCRTEAVPGVEWGTRIQRDRISLYLNGSSAATQRMAVRLQEHFGRELFVVGDWFPIDGLLGTVREQQVTIAGAESCTGGLVSQMLTAVPGSSGYFLGTVTAYHNSAKEHILGVPHTILEQYGAVSAETAAAMAERARRLFSADAAYGITGIAGPDGGNPAAGKPVGTVWLGFAAKDRAPVALRMNFHPYTRESVRIKAANAALLLLDLYLRGEELLDIVNKWQYI